MNIEELRQECLRLIGLLDPSPDLVKLKKEVKKSTSISFLKKTISKLQAII